MVVVAPSRFAGIGSTGAYDTGMRECLITRKESAAMESRLGEE